MKGKVICYWIVVLCGLTHNACAGTGARYGAGSSTRAMPDYSNSGRMICENQEGTFETLVKNAAAAKGAVYNSAWSGTRKDLEAIVKKAEQNYGFEDSKNLGRNATMLVPATLEEMRKEIVFGNPYGWDKEMLDYEHQPKGKGDSNVKYTTLSGDKNRQRNEQMGYEVVYDRITGRIVPNKYMGTKNFEPLYSALCLTCYPQNVNHIPKDMMPHKTKANPQNQFEKDGDQYKYVGILYERDSNDPEKYYIIDGQTGLPMTPQKVANMPTTLSDMWKDMGLACVANDAEDIIPQKKVQHNNKENGGRKICSCTSSDVFFAGVCKKKVGVIKNRLWAQYYCRNCGGFCRGSMFELMKTDKGVSVYPAGSVPSDWDGKIYEQSELEAHVRELNNGVKPERENAREEEVNTDVNQQPKTDDSQVGVRGWCKCGAEHGKIYYVGYESDYAYHLCGRCGKVDRPWRKKGEDANLDSIRIIDNRIVKKYEECAGRDIPKYQYRAMLKRAEDSFILKIAVEIPSCIILATKNRRKRRKVRI